ncbi:hypothetical protein BT63DRAFT_197579 [Microthyrium microscopicum]|uniref:Spermatogenesis-associated protein 20-like TRX domain-containing protein n=1 Tax=Microthyrium microscopicum TaxID=703497 RepID=A0A6A6UJT2_9PEZI|nr:hypothetical protein BT63DRAFT_197579 [Microthyrium microscopicum]
MSTVTENVDVGGQGRELKLVNCAGSSRSPYVREHGRNPVAWQLWDPETLKLAKDHNRLIFLSVGYSACHWCHVMERESFENADVAKYLNTHFIPIKLDREERPDIDRIYMNYVQATTGGGGWPLNVFLTPDREPLFGGTYWPGPSPALREQVDFMSILKKMEQVWREQRQKCIDSAKVIANELRQFAQEGLISREGIAKEAGHEDLEIDLLDDAIEHFKLKYDHTNGGFGIQPKFPTPVNLRFLLSPGQYPQNLHEFIDEPDIEQAANIATHTLTSMYRGGIKDQIGHGFARYSVTRDWGLPHFEKMLYDQVQLLPAYLDAYLIRKDPLFLDAVLDIAAYLLSPPIHAPNGGFYSSEDADSKTTTTDTEKREGAFYVWTSKELVSVLGERDAGICAAYWNVQENGNVPPDFDVHDELMNQSVLAVSRTPEELSKQFGLGAEQVVTLLESSRQKLRAYREKERPRPMLDDKIVLAWNGLAIGALARTAAVLAKIKPDVAKQCLDAAEKAAGFVKREMVDSKGDMKRVWREQLGEAPAFADDYAFLIAGLIDLYEASWDDQWLEWADSLQKTQTKLFWDEEHGGFFSTSMDQTDLILRLKDGMDNAEPSTNGVSAQNLNRLGAMLEDEAYIKQAKRTVHAFDAEILQHPFLFVSMLESVVAEFRGMKTIVITGSGENVDKYIDEVRDKTPWGRTVVRIGGGVEGKWLKERNTLIKAMDVEKAGVQLCENGACRDVLEGDVPKVDVKEEEATKEGAKIQQ